MSSVLSKYRGVGRTGLGVAGEPIKDSVNRLPSNQGALCLKYTFIPGFDSDHPFHGTSVGKEFGDTDSLYSVNFKNGLRINKL